MATRQSFGSLAFVIAAVVAAMAGRPAVAEELRPGQTIEREIAGTRADVYELSLHSGEAATITVAQNGIDIVLSVKDASGALLVETDRESRRTGREQTVVVSDGAAVDQIGIRARYPRAPAGRYAVSVAVHPAGDTDRALSEAAALATKAVSLRDSGKLPESRDAAKRAVESAERAVGPNDAFIGYLLMPLGAAEGILAHYPAAREVFKRAATISESTLGHDDPQTAQALENLGNVYARENDFANAEKYLRDARSRMEAALGADHPRVATSLLDLGFLYLYLDPAKSVAFLEPALRIADRAIDPDEFIVGAITNNLATAYVQLRDYDKAEPLLQRALQSFEKKRGPSHPLVAYPLQDLGIIAREHGDYDRALSLLWQAEAIRQRAFGADHPDTVHTLELIGSVLAAQGRTAEALEMFRDDLQMFEASLGPYNERTFDAVSDVGAMYAAQGDIACAIEYQKRANAIADKDLALNLAIGSERQKLAYAESMAAGTDRTISLHVDDAPDDSRAAELALLAILQRKGRVLDAMSENIGIMRRGIDPADRPLLDELGAVTTELAKTALGSGGKGARERIARIGKLEGKIDRLEEQIGAHSVAFRTRHRPVTIESIREAIPSNAALVEIASYRPYRAAAPGEASSYGSRRYVAYVLRRRGPIGWRDLGEAKAIDAAVAKWRRALRDPRSDGRVPGRALSRRLIQPLQPLIAGASQLLISPDGQLCLIPFEALAGRDGRYLVERYSISYLTSGRDLLRMKMPRGENSAPPVIVADPLFDMAADTSSAGQTARRGVVPGEEFAVVRFAPLSGTKEEALGIRQVFPDARLLTGRAASKRAVQQLTSPEILHLATHGFFFGLPIDGDAPNAQLQRGARAADVAMDPLLRSGLAFSGANVGSGSSREDGVLTALEVSTMDLRGTKLVTLSACDSGMGDVRNGEGVYGLRRAFVLAGAETVVMSLWSVSDYATRQVMTAYYRALRRGGGRGESLRRAKLAMLRSAGHSHPFYWASFIQSGDWTPLAVTR